MTLEEAELSAANAEIARLRALSAELLGALRDLVGETGEGKSFSERWDGACEAIERARGVKS